MGWVMDGLESDAYDRTYGDLVLVRRVLAYFAPHWRPMLVVVVMVLLHSGISAGMPILISRGIDLVTQGASLASIYLLGATLLLFSSLSWVTNYLQQIQAARAVGDMLLELGQDVFAAVTAHDMSFYDEQPSGKIVNRVTTDTVGLSEVVMLVINLLSQLVLVVILFVALFRINVYLALLLLGMVPVIVGVALSFRRIARVVTRRARRVLAEVNALIQESISGIAVAKNFRQEAAVYNGFLQLNQRAYRVGLTRGWVLNTIIPLLGTGIGVSTAMMVHFGGWARIQGLITPGDWYLFIQTMGMIWFPLTSVASFWSQFQDGLSAAERVFSLIDAEPRVVQTAAEPVKEIEGRIEFRNVHFAYTSREVVLRDFSLNVQAGETVALVGHTGAGKSSLARLIERFYEFQGGQILIDGRDARSFDLGQYRRHIGLVPQEPFLFSGTLGDNIHYSRPEATGEEVAAAARRIARGEWLDDLPNGLQTDVGERGSQLSMGQRQLVALARVTLADPRILILDEATASVDPFTEAQIQEGLEMVMQGRTCIVIAHRLSTVRNAGRIIVLRNGEIIEEGNHDSLLAAGGHYAELYNTYFRHQSLEYIEQAHRLGGARDG
jgi:ABC-type multidrug transport system fused ATPase/permease subunit